MKHAWFSSIIAAVIVGAVSPVYAPAQEGAYSGAVTVRTVLRTTATQSGQPLRYPKGQPQVTMLQVDIPPGGQTGWHTHPVPGFAFVQSGRLTLQTRHGSHTFTAGQAFAETVDTPHNGRNLGRVPVKIVVVFTGIAGRPIVKKL